MVPHDAAARSAGDPGAQPGRAESRAPVPRPLAELLGELVQATGTVVRLRQEASEQLAQARQELEHLQARKRELLGNTAEQAPSRSRIERPTSPKKQDGLLRVDKQAVPARAQADQLVYPRKIEPPPTADGLQELVRPGWDAYRQLSDACRELDEIQVSRRFLLAQIAQLERARGGLALPRRAVVGRLSRAAVGCVQIGRATGGPIALLLLGVMLWASSLAQVEPRNMTELGLISVLPPQFFVGILLLTVGFCLAVHRRETPTPLLLLYVVTLIIIVHGTPPLVYGTLRYAWAWKHVGLVDYIQRFGGVDPSIDAYHNWPGFFALSALGVQIAGVDSALRMAIWAQPAFNMLFVGPLLLIMKAFTQDRRVQWLGVWFFFLFNWVGQDYFSPQAFAYFLHLVILAICLHCFRAAGPSPLRAIERWRLAAPVLSLARRFAPTPTHDPVPADFSLSPGKRIAMLVIVVVLFAITVGSHQLTPLFTVLAVAALVFVGRCSARALPALMVVLAATWITYVATTFLGGHLSGIASSIFRPLDNVAARYVDLPQAVPIMRLIAMVNSALTAAALLLALLGYLRRLRRGRYDLAALALLLAPIPLVAGNSYGGEILFRVYFFTIPFAAYFVTALLYPSRGSGTSWRTLAASTALSCLLLVGLLAAYYGKDRMHYFTQNEIDAAEYLNRTAPRGSLWLDGTWNWPLRYKRYEYYAHRSLMQLTKDERDRLDDDPVGVLVRLMQDSRYPEAYLTITRSQKMHVAMTGVMPEGSLDRIDAAVQRSGRFTVVFSNADATIFKLRPDTTPGGP